MKNPYALTDTPNNDQTDGTDDDTPTDVTDVADDTPNFADVDDLTLMTSTGDSVPDGFISLSPAALTLSQALTPIDISRDDDDDDPHIPDTFTLGETALPPTGDSFQEIPPDLDPTSNIPVHASLSVEPDLDEGEITSDDDDPDNPTTRAAEATMNISLAALGDTIRQQIETRQQEIDERLSLLYAQRAELTERIAATGDAHQQGQ